MGFIDSLRMRNLYPSTGIGPPNMTGGFDILNSLNLQQQPQPLPQNLPPDDWFTRHAKLNSARRDDVQTQEAEKQFRDSQNPLLNTKVPGFLESPNEIQDKKKELLAMQIAGQTEKADRTNALGYAKLEQAGELGNRRIDIQQQRADVYDFKAKHPNMQIKAPAGGNYTLFDPQTGEAVDSGVSTGTMRQEDFQKLLGTQRLEQIGAQGTNQQTLQNTRGNQALAQIGARIQGQKDLQSSKPAPTVLPSQQKVGIQNKASQIMNTNPELGQFITTNSDGTVSITPPGYGGPSLAQYAEINQQLYPKASTLGTSNNAPASPDPQWKYVPKPGGGWTAVKVGG